MALQTNNSQETTLISAVQRKVWDSFLACWTRVIGQESTNKSKEMWRDITREIRQVTRFLRSCLWRER